MKGMAFTLMFPLVQVNYQGLKFTSPLLCIPIARQCFLSEEVTRDYVSGAVDNNLRIIRLLPWFYRNIIDVVPNDPLPQRTMADLSNEVQ
jgi:hypothetical protein